MRKIHAHKPAPDHPWRRPIRRPARAPSDSLGGRGQHAEIVPDLVDLVARAERGLKAEPAE